MNLTLLYDNIPASHMNIDIYYFSGTGDSLSVAKDIAAKTGGNLVPIASVVDNDVINPDSDVIGMCFRSITPNYP